jgi:2-phospho-L-lactate guanylyltransferase
MSDGRVSHTAMRVWAVVPAKSFTRAKSRLEAALPPAARRALARSLLERALSACAGCTALEATLVATDGDDVAQLAARFHAQVVRDVPGRASRLAAVVDAALEHARARGATHAVVLMSDLPLIRARDLAEVVAALSDHPVVIVPDAQRRGTGALGISLAQPPRTRFGYADSFMRHVAMARSLGVDPRVLVQPRLARDVDGPSDAAHAQPPSGPRVRRVWNER